ncbi:hypothetical protein [Tetragenococcus halophilus]|uniref:hypothetical protein n=1 Tax=Tetragenococcus halophilus TaxID=51669 RepID=UPI002A947AD1|nr:hypothetical protein TEHSL10_19410 [Tetragenococcus halophilus]
MIKIILTAVVISFVVSFSMMKLQMKMIEKWMNNFFQEEKKFLRDNLIQRKDQ